jgi:hypothetical protein
MSKILVTNNGAHPADKWAMTSAEEIFPMQDAALTGEHLIAAQRFQLDLAELLEDHHGNVQAGEKDSLASHDDHCDSAIEIQHHVTAALAAVVEKSKGTVWEAHFAKPEVQKAVEVVLNSHFQSSAHIERLWHADKNPDNGAAQKYKSTH